MKKSLLTILFFSNLLLGNFSFSSVVDNNDPFQNEIILTFEKLSEKQFEDLDLVILNLPGIKSTGYCQKMNCYYFKYDSNLYKSREEAFHVIEIQARQFLPLLKEGVNSELINNICINL
jgi:hypothetical protein